MTNPTSLQDFLALAMPQAIKELQAQGGPSKEDFDRATGFADTLASRGDVLLFGSKKKGEAAKMFEELVHSVAVLSFAPGGVEIFGQRWESKNSPPFS